MKFKIKGKMKYLSKEQVRSILHACDTILTFHNKHPHKNEIIVEIVKDGTLGKTKVGGKCVGKAIWKKGMIKIVDNFLLDNTITILLHEMIHLYYRVDNSCIEKITSTMTAKLKPDVTALYNILVEGVYKRAGYFAHCKMSYLPEGKDYYDKEQYKKTNPSRKHYKIKGKFNISKIKIRRKVVKA